MLARRISTAIGAGFKIAPPPTIAARVSGGAEIAFSHFANADPKPGLSAPSNWEEAFVFNIPLVPATYPLVSINGKGRPVTQVPGKAYLFDLTNKNEVSLDAVYNSVRFHLPLKSIDEMAYDKGLRRVGGLRAEVLGQEDLILYRLARIVLPAILNSAEVTSAFVEYIALALHDHVIYRYGGLARGSRIKGGLTPRQIRSSCDFIESNLAGDLSIAALGRECGLSASHFAQAFRASLGMAPHKWITKRRIARAQAVMSQSSESLAEIALVSGFVDQSHLGRIFLKEVGTSPARWRRERSALRLLPSDRRFEV